MSGNVSKLAGRSTENVKVTRLGPKHEGKGEETVEVNVNELEERVAKLERMVAALTETVLVGSKPKRKKRKTREWTDEERKAFRERMVAARQAKEAERAKAAKAAEEAEDEATEAEDATSEMDEADAEEPAPESKPKRKRKKK